MKDIMLADTPVEQRAQILRDSCDQIVERSYTRKFDHYLSNGDVLLQLVSPGANELAEDYRDKCIDEVLDGIRAIAPDIAILEI